MLAVTLAVILAQDAGAGGWASLVGSGANILFSVGVATYLLTRALPDLQAKFLASLEKAQSEFIKTQDRQEEKFESALKDQRAAYDARESQRREEHRASLAAIIGHCEKESARRDEQFRVEMAAMGKTVEAVGLVLEQVRIEMAARNAQRRRREPPAEGR